jgi:UDP-glucose 4-epimerase
VKVIVTGGCGFIGSHMVDKLLNEGNEAIVIDNLSSGNLQNLEHHRDNQKLNVNIISILVFDKIESLFIGVEKVFHFAALTDIVPSIEKPMQYHNSNVDGTINVLEACRKHGVKRVIYTASSSCYGLPDVFPAPETSDIRCQYLYAVTKHLEGEITYVPKHPDEPDYAFADTTKIEKLLN